MTLLTAALAAFVAVFGLFFFPFPSALLARALLDASGVAPEPGYVNVARMMVHGALSFLVGLGVAFVLFRALDVRSHAKALVKYRRWLRVGLMVMGIYLLAVPMLLVASSLP